MPFEKVMDKFKKGKLHSGSKKGKKVTNHKQAMAIMMSEKKEGKEEYKSNKKSSVEPTEKFKKRFGVK